MGCTRLAREGRTEIEALDLAKKARAALVEKKGEAISLLDVRGLSGVTDYYIVASGSSPPHLKAMLNEVQHVLKNDGVHCYRKSGNPECGWLVIDYIDVVIHIFSSEARQYYTIEKLWAQTPPKDPSGKIP